jgi:aryl-alcohol dehydrogenase-like predicted oxidoreductase
MNKRRLGKTDIEISALGMGCWQLAQGGNALGRFWDTQSAAQAAETVSAALESGISWFDTAEVYGKGSSERSLSASLASLGVKPGSVVVATKWFPLFRTARSIGKTIDTRISCLGNYPIDLHQVHQPYSFSPVAAQMREMAALVKAHKIRSVGVSNFSARAMETAHAALAAEGIPLASNQIRFNLLDRRIEKNGTLASAKKLGVTLIAYSPLAQGVLSGRFHRDPGAAAKLSSMRRMMSRTGAAALERSRPLVQALEEIGRAHGGTASQVALAWAVTFHGDTIVAIPGASRAAQARENGGALALTLSAKELGRLDELSRSADMRQERKA